MKAENAVKQGGKGKMRICELRDKEVVNSKDCKIIGCVGDVDFDPCNGCIKAIIVPGPPKLWGFLGRDIEYVIPFKCICRIGPDVILVDVCLEDVIEKCS